MNVIRQNFCLAIIFLCFQVSNSFGQGSPLADQEQNAHTGEGSIFDLSLRPIRLPSLQEVGGSPFLNSEYKLGSVLISDEKKVSNVPVKFNIFSNAVMVQREGKEMKLESFKLVSYNVPGNQGEDSKINLGQGYPDIDNHSGTSVYQVLAYGPKIHLLKFLSQKVEDAPTLGDYSRREIVTTGQLYLYSSGGEIKSVKPGKKSVTAALSAMKEKVEEILGSTDLNLKNESDIVTLVDALNR